jgi:hypothetical protein
MRLGPATQAALLSRMLPTAVFRQGRKIIAPRLRRAPDSDPTEALAPGSKFSASILPLEEDFGGGRNARAPVHWT